MKFYSVKEIDMTNIADAIRAKTGKADGMTPTQMSDEIAGIPERMEAEEIIVPLNMANGDMVVNPTECKTISKATIQKPETLVPANIAKDVDIAGVVGTLESGGACPAVFTVGKAYCSYSHNVSNGNVSNFEISLEIPGNAEIIKVCVDNGASMGGTSAKSLSTIRSAPCTTVSNNYSINNGEDVITVSLTYRPYSSYAYAVRIMIVSVMYVIPGITIVGETLNADSGITDWPGTDHCVSGKFNTVDLSASAISEIPYGAFSGCVCVSRVLLPATVTTIKNYAFYGIAAGSVIDLSRSQSIPSISSKYIIDPADTNVQFLVPAALYDEWIAATNWSDLADYIVAV